MSVLIERCRKRDPILINFRPLLIVIAVVFCSKVTKIRSTLGHFFLKSLFNLVRDLLKKVFLGPPGGHFWAFRSRGVAKKKTERTPRFYAFATPLEREAQKWALEGPTNDTFWVQLCFSCCVGDTFLTLLLHLSSGKLKSDPGRSNTWPFSAFARRNTTFSRLLQAVTS
jgi:hypothetical protein